MTDNTTEGEEGIRGAPVEIVTLTPRAKNTVGRRKIAEIDLALAEMELNDIGNAERLIARHGDDLLYVREVGWPVWDGRYWLSTGAEELTRKRAHKTAREVICEGEALIMAAKRLAKQAGAIDLEQAEAKAKGEEGARLAGRGTALFNWAIESGDRRRITAMIEEAKPYLTVEPEAMDKDRRAITLANGYLKLEGGCETLLDHAREHHASGEHGVLHRSGRD